MMKFKNDNIRCSELKFSEVFSKIFIAKSSDSNKLKKGLIPFIGRSSVNNGFQNEYEISKEKIVKKNCITVSMVGEVRAFYQEFDFACSQNILILRNDQHLNKANSLYLCTIINKFLYENGFGYGYPVGLKRILRSHLFLPVYKNAADWKFMENYMEQELNKYTIKIKNNYIKKLEMLSEEKLKIEAIDWKAFWIEDICNIKSGVRLTKANMQVGNTPFISATEYGNGVTNFVNNTNKSKNSNVLGVNYNGSVVKNFYHPYECIFSDDVKQLEFKKKEHCSKYNYLFLKQMILQQENKYTYGYKFKAERMKRQKIMLPVDWGGNIDWVYMTNYMKFIERKNIYEVLKLFK